jgi:translation elongation factor EF-1alpha
MDRRKDEKDILTTKYFSTYAIETNAKAYTLINVPGKFQHLKEILIGIALADIAVLVLSGIRE